MGLPACRADCISLVRLQKREEDADIRKMLLEALLQVCDPPTSCSWQEAPSVGVLCSCVRPGAAASCCEQRRFIPS
jgi:hypothetical protein